MTVAGTAPLLDRVSYGPSLSVGTGDLEVHSAPADNRDGATWLDPERFPRNTHGFPSLLWKTLYPLRG